MRFSERLAQEELMLRREKHAAGEGMFLSSSQERRLLLLQLDGLDAKVEDLREAVGTILKSLDILAVAVAGLRGTTEVHGAKPLVIK
jgi:hypothetical protein